jgi:hypothetical protein
LFKYSALLDGKTTATDVAGASGVVKAGVAVPACTLRTALVSRAFPVSSSRPVYGKVLAVNTDASVCLGVTALACV